MASNPAQLGAWERTLNAIERHGPRPFTPLAPDELQARTGSRRHLAPSGLVPTD